MDIHFPPVNTDPRFLSLIRLSHELWLWAKAQVLALHPPPHGMGFSTYGECYLKGGRKEVIFQEEPKGLASHCHNPGVRASYPSSPQLHAQKPGPGALMPSVRPFHGSQTSSKSLGTSSSCIENYCLHIASMGRSSSLLLLFDVS